MAKQIRLNLEWNVSYPEDFLQKKIVQFRSGIIELQMWENGIYLVPV